MKTRRRIDIPCGQTYLFELSDGSLLESGDVYMAREHRYGERPYHFHDFRKPSDKSKRVMTLCTMAGCPVGCRFCASARTFRRKLSAEEIVGQVAQMVHEGTKLGRDPDPNNAQEFRILYTRMGEPMLNAEQVVDSIRLLVDAYPHVIIGMSTSGHQKGLDHFLNNADVLPYVDMQFSLHSTDDRERDWLFRGTMGKTMLSIPQIAEYVEKWSEHTSKKTALNVILFEDFTYDFKSLLQYFDPQKIWLRLSPWNIVNQSSESFSGLLQASDVLHKKPMSGVELQRIIQDIEAAGISFAYAPAIDEEINHQVACGQALEAFQHELVSIDQGKKRRLSLPATADTATEAAL